MNDENKKQIIVLAVLLLALGGALWFFIFKGSPGGPAIQAGQNTANQGALDGLMAAQTVPNSRISSVFQESSVDLQELIQNIMEVEFNYAEEHDARNPTAALVGDAMLFRAMRNKVAEGSQAENLLYEASRKKVTGIIWDETEPLAVIDDQVVSVGFEFDEPIVVKSIQHDHVVLALIGEDLEVVRQLKEQ